MKVNKKKIIYNNFLTGDLEFFKVFNIYKIIDCKKEILTKKYINNGYYSYKERLKICNVESTIPTIYIKECEIINLEDCNELEDCNLLSNKLVIIGELKFSLIVFYNNNSNIIKNLVLSFNTFILIPSDINCREIVNLFYLIEDVSLVRLNDDKIMVSVTSLIEYKDEYVRLGSI